MKQFSTIILAAGKGSRMKSALPKPLHPLAHKPMLQYVIESCKQAGAQEIVVVISADDTLTPSLFPDVTMAVQQEQKGTGHALLTGINVLKKSVDTIVSLMGDHPFIEPDMIQKLATTENTVTVLAMQPEDPLRYGRLIVTNDGILEKIVEYKDATEQQRAITVCNSGTIALCGRQAKELLSSIKTNNAAGEYYMTDVVGIARQKGERCGILLAPYNQTAGANTRQELAYLENIVQSTLREKHMTNGVTLMDPATVYFSHDTAIGQDTVIEPNVVFGPKVSLGDNVRIKAFSHIESAIIPSGTIVGPFARIDADNPLVL